MKKISKILSNMSIISIVYANESPPTNPLRDFSHLPTEFYSDLLKYLPAVDLIKVESIGNRLLKSKIESAQKTKVQIELNKLSPEELEHFKEFEINLKDPFSTDLTLPPPPILITLTDTRSMYGLITYASNLLLLIRGQKFTDFLVRIGHIGGIIDKVRGEYDTLRPAIIYDQAVKETPERVAKFHYLFEKSARIDSRIASLKIDAHIMGTHGYKESKKDAEAFIDELIDLEMPWAIYHRYHDLDRQQDTHNFIEKLAARKNPWALARKFGAMVASYMNEDGSTSEGDAGYDGYEKDIKAAHTLLEERLQELESQGTFTDKDNEFHTELDFNFSTRDDFMMIGSPLPSISWAIFIKFHGLVNGHYGFQQDIPAAHNFLEKLIDRKIDWAIETKYSGLLEGIDGYQKDLAAANIILDEQFQQRRMWAIDKKLSVSEPEDVKKLLEQGRSRKESWAVKRTYHPKFILAIHGIKPRHREIQLVGTAGFEPTTPTPPE